MRCLLAFSTFLLVLPWQLISAAPARRANAHFLQTPDQTEVHKQILEELRAMHKLLEEIKRELSELKRERKPETAAPPESPSPLGKKTPKKAGSLLEKLLPFLPSKPDSGFRSQGPDLKALQSIKLPDNPTEEDVRKYIDKIIEASLKQSTFSTRDPQVSMLVQLGPERVPLLIEAMTKRGTGRLITDLYFISALKLLVNEKHKKLVLEALPLCPSLAEVVRLRGWEKEAREILLSGLKTRSSLPIEWIRAVADLEDPETYPDLISYFIGAPNQSSVYEAIRDLPGIKLREAVKKAWRRAKFGGSWDRNEMAKIAVAYGLPDAFVALARSYLERDYFPYEEERIAMLLRRFTSRSGTAEEIAEWVVRNADRISFDARKRKYILKEDKPKQRKETF